MCNNLDGFSAIERSSAAQKTVYYGHMGLCMLPLIKW